MDFRAVLIFLCLFIAQASCGLDRKTRAVSKTIERVRSDTSVLLDRLPTLVQLPNISCLFLNTTELGKPEQESLTSHHLSSFRCYMLKLSNLTVVSQELKNICQYIQDVIRLMRGHPAQDCSLPPMQHMDRYVYIKCLLQLLDQRLSKAKF